MRNKNLLWFPVLLLVVLSCKKSSSPDDEDLIVDEPCAGCLECPVDEVSRLGCGVAEFVYSGTLYEDIIPDRNLITYNAQGQIAKIERFNENGLAETTNYTYRSNEILVERVLDDEFVLGTENYTLNNKGLITSFPLRNNIRIQATYNDQDQLIRLETDPEATSYNLSEISYEGENISSIKVVNGSSSSENYIDVTLTYDLTKAALAFQSMRVFGLNTLFDDIALRKNTLYETGYFGKPMQNALVHQMRVYSTGGNYETPFTYYCNNEGHVFRMQMGDVLSHTYTYECED